MSAISRRSRALALASLAWAAANATNAAELAIVPVSVNRPHRVVEQEILFWESDVVDTEGPVVIVVDVQVSDWGPAGLGAYQATIDAAGTDSPLPGLIFETAEAPEYVCARAPGLDCSTDLRACGDFGPCVRNAASVDEKAYETAEAPEYVCARAPGLDCSSDLRACGDFGPCVRNAASVDEKAYETAEVPEYVCARAPGLDCSSDLRGCGDFGPCVRRVVAMFSDLKESGDAGVAVDLERAVLNGHVHLDPVRDTGLARSLGMFRIVLPTAATGTYAISFSQSGFDTFVLNGAGDLEPVGLRPIRIAIAPDEDFCRQNADCDDGLWCNGAEACVNARCVAGHPIAELDEPCAEPNTRSKGRR
ncbi:MAG: hypothetical protein HY763_10510 [Planctomycetes bacterium]|nr:hypothetical protein [Planctomycetota bacterium]